MYPNNIIIGQIIADSVDTTEANSQLDRLYSCHIRNWLTSANHKLIGWVSNNLILLMISCT